MLITTRRSTRKVGGEIGAVYLGRESVVQGAIVERVTEVQGGLRAAAKSQVDTKATYTH